MSEQREQLEKRYSAFSSERLKEITVKNGYTEEAEEVATEALKKRGVNSTIDDIDEKPLVIDVPVKESSNNKVGEAIRIMAFIIMIAGCILSFLFTSGAFELTIISILAILASGLLLLGFAEIIRLLQDIKNKLK